MGRFPSAPGWVAPRVTESPLSAQENRIWVVMPSAWPAGLPRHLMQHKPECLVPALTSNLTVAPIDLLYVVQATYFRISAATIELATTCVAIFKPVRLLHSTAAGEEVGWGTGKQGRQVWQDRGRRPHKWCRVTPL